jgi:molybdate/tungstate transport system substrate-binding protein
MKLTRLKRPPILVAVIIMALVLGAAITINLFNKPEVEKQTLKILCAGSLLFPMERIADAFQRSHPTVNVEIEGHGSIQVIRQVTELGQKADLLMVADYSLIPAMMYGISTSGSNESFADWYIRFAGNSIVLAHTTQSKYSSEITNENWFDILARDDVKFGFPNPLIDSLGYKALMTIQLAERYYGDNKIFEMLVSRNFDPQFTTYNSGNKTYIVVPEEQNAVTGRAILRASSIQLMPLLEAGAIDYCFLYLSNARQQNFTYIELPGEINLGSSQYQADYQTIRVKYLQQRFSTVTLDRDGETIYYGLTIPYNAPNKDLAATFVEYILKGEGKDIFRADFQPVFTPSFTDNPQAVLEELKPLVTFEPK